MQIKRDLTECVDILREAAEEFSTKYRFMINLDFGLHPHGLKTNGLKVHIKDDSDYVLVCPEYALQRNSFWRI